MSYTPEQAKEFVRTRTDAQLDAEFEQAHAAMCDLNNTKGFRESAMYAACMLGTEKLRRMETK